MPKLKKGQVGRYVVWPKDLDKWLQDKAKEHGLNSPQKFAVMSLMGDMQRTDDVPQKRAS